MESNEEPKRPGLFKMHKTSLSISSISSAASSLNSNLPLLRSKANDSALETFRVLKKFASFIGPGFLVAVAYIDPGNYSTDVAAGASNKYALLFVVIMSNMFAIFLQSLCIKLGSVTGMDLAENCRAHLPKWMVIPLYVLSEAAIVATDVAEVNIPPWTLCFVNYVLTDNRSLVPQSPSICSPEFLLWLDVPLHWWMCCFFCCSTALMAT